MARRVVCCNVESLLQEKIGVGQVDGMRGVGVLKGVEAGVPVGEVWVLGRIRGGSAAVRR